ncbi:hypothetical protein M8C21_011016 [Ambrosia artemisiifolia]|uniref:Uncharacterized protein n=1 Tax=Ambrosia artemisiifolia TaxID=4212 RepID=A0AAD5G232_AMBAR|nr:hypothetical protein M8C21_011016 [Ambrosia artemisiifolia]
MEMAHPSRRTWFLATYQHQQCCLSHVVRRTKKSGNHYTYTIITRPGSSLLAVNRVLKENLRPLIYTPATPPSQIIKTPSATEKNAQATPPSTARKVSFEEAGTLSIAKIFTYNTDENQLMKLNSHRNF